MADLHFCAICGGLFSPDPRCGRRQRYCGPLCAKRAKAKRDREHKRRYRETGLGAEQRRRESQERRTHLDWPRRMQAWRKTNLERSRQIDREAAGRYYRAHRTKILERRRIRRGLSDGVAQIARRRPGALSARFEVGARQTDEALWFFKTVGEFRRRRPVYLLSVARTVARTKTAFARMGPRERIAGRRGGLRLERVLRRN